MWSVEKNLIAAGEVDIALLMIQARMEAYQEMARAGQAAMPSAGVPAAQAMMAGRTGSYYLFAVPGGPSPLAAANGAASPLGKHVPYPYSYPGQGSLLRAPGIIGAPVGAPVGSLLRAPGIIGAPVGAPVSTPVQIPYTYSYPGQPSFPSGQNGAASSANGVAPQRIPQYIELL